MYNNDNKEHGDTKKNNTSSTLPQLPQNTVADNTLLSSIYTCEI